MSDDIILLVDDEEDIRDVLSLALMDKGYQVLLAENGQQGLELFQAHRPPIILTDIKMPGMDGIELLKKVKEQDPDTEVIMITGHGDMDLAIKSFQYEAIEFIKKPVDVRALSAALKKVNEKILIRRQMQAYTHRLENLVHQKTVKLDQMQKWLKNTPHQQEFIKAQEKFSELFDDLPCYLSVIDKDLKIASINRRFRNDFGDATGQLCYTVLQSAAGPCNDCPVLKTFGTGQSFQQNIELKPASGNPAMVFLWTSPIRDENGQISQVLCMLTHINQLIEAKEHLSNLGLMISSVSHGIKGLLTGLDAGIYLLDAGVIHKDWQRAEEGLDIVKQLIQRIRRMVLDILFYAKEREIRMEPIDLDCLIQDIDSTIRPKCEDHHILFTIDRNLTTNSVNADANSLSIALVNILENAVDACIDDQSKPDHCIDFTIKSDPDQVLFKISDNGIGMPPDIKDKIFSLFFSAKGKKGTGLGLFITQHIVSQHSGKIVVDSQKGQGTSFSITIPGQQ